MFEAERKQHSERDVSAALDRLFNDP